MNDMFKKQVFEIIGMIPSGRMTSYGAVAKAVGYPNHARHVGNVLRDYDDDFPAHRVCNATGHITAGCLEEFVRKLKREGIAVEGTKVCDFRRIFWNPLDEI